MDEKKAMNIKDIQVKDHLKRKGAAHATKYKSYQLVTRYFCGGFIHSLRCLRLIVPESLHGMSAFLDAMLPAFKWLTFGGFLLGLIESFLSERCEQENIRSWKSLNPGVKID